MDEVIEEFKRLEDEKRLKFIYEIHESANSNALNNPLVLAIASCVCKETGVKFIKDINNVATENFEIPIDKEYMVVNNEVLGKKCVKEAYKAIVDFINNEKDYEIRLFDIEGQLDVDNAMLHIKLEYVRDLNDE